MSLSPMEMSWELIDPIAPMVRHVQAKTPRSLQCVDPLVASGGVLLNIFAGGVLLPIHLECSPVFFVAGKKHALGRIFLLICSKNKLIE